MTASPNLIPRHPSPRPRATLFPLLAAVALAAPCAPAASPQLDTLLPRGVPRGTETTFSLIGERLGDIVEVLPYSPGFEIKDVRPDHEEGKKALATIAVAPDVPLGEHCFRIRTKSGISYLRTLWIDQFPTYQEQETNEKKNDDFFEPEPVPLAHTIEGTIEREDVDYYAFEAKQGQRVSAEIIGMRDGQRKLDPYIAVLDQKRFEVAVSDDTALLAQDAFLSFHAPENGIYILEVRETSYNADGRCDYRIHLGDFPRPTGIYPPGGKAGSTLEITYLGDLGGEKKESLQLPAEPTPKHAVFMQADGRSAPSPNYVRVSTFDNVLEAEPNDSREQATATPAPLPLAFNGIIEKPGDTDHFKFTAQKDKEYEVNTYARALRSPLDSVVDVFKADGGRIEGNDDNSQDVDSAFKFKAPEDGEYFLEVRDHLSNGGADYVYRVEIVSPEPSLVASVPQFDRRDTQERKMFPVPRGNRFATLLNFERDSVKGDLVVTCPDLLPGMTLHAEPVPDGINQFPVVFEAAPDAPIAGHLGRLEVALADGSLKGGFSESLELPVADNNQRPWRLTTNDRVALGVVEEIPFTIELVPPPVPIVQNGTMNLLVKAHRNEGYEEEIEIRLLWKPPGIGGQNSMKLPKDQSELQYPINGEGNAQTQTWKIVVQGEANAGGRVFASSQLTPLTVAPPYLKMNIEMASVELGQNVELVCNLEQLTPFEGKASVKLIGLPHNTTTEDREITKDDTKLVFPITTQADSPPGKHKNLFCQVTVTENGAPILHNVGHGGVLRIDKPAEPDAEIAAKE